MIFPVALLQKNCEHVDTSEIEASFANPHSLVLISFLACVAVKVYEMLMNLMKLQSFVTKSAGSGLSACVKSVVACAKTFILCKCFGYIPSKVQTRLPADLEESILEEVEATVDEKTDDLIEQSRGYYRGAIDDSIEDKIASHNEGLAKKMGELQEEANELFGADLADPEEEEATTTGATYEEYKRNEEKEETSRQSKMAQSTGFTLIHLGIALAVAADYYQKINSVVIGQGIMCQVSKVLVMPLFTPFAVSMWNVLAKVIGYINWEHTHRATPKDVEHNGLTPPPLRPVHRNILATVIVLTSAAALSAWGCAAMVVAPALFGFLPIVLIFLVAVPLALLVLPLACVSYVWSWIPENVSQLENRRLKKLRDIFSKLNGDRSNVESISKEELRAHWTKTTGQTRDLPHAQRFIDEKWDEIDVDGDGKVSISEFMNAVGVGEAWEMSDKEDSVVSFAEVSLAKLLGSLAAYPSLWIKVGLMQAFVMIMLIAWFGGVYYGHESWSSASEAIYAELSSLTAHIALSWPTLAFSASFKLPTLNWPSTTLLFVSLGTIFAEYLQKFFARMDLVLGDRERQGKTVQTALTFATTLVYNLG
jgi:hypothetical protein